MEQVLQNKSQGWQAQLQGDQSVKGSLVARRRAADHKPALEEGLRGKGFSLTAVEQLSEQGEGG